MNGRISLDTNTVIRFFKNDVHVVTILADFAELCLPVPVIAELLFAAKNSARQTENLKKYNEFIDSCTILNITRETASHYSFIRLDLKKKGKPIPENDLWIAAVCKEQGLPLFTEDAHFDDAWIMEGKHSVQIPLPAERLLRSFFLDRVCLFFL